MYFTCTRFGEQSKAFCFFILGKSAQALLSLIHVAMSLLLTLAWGNSQACNGFTFPWIFLHFLWLLGWGSVWLLDEGDQLLLQATFFTKLEGVRNWHAFQSILALMGYRAHSCVCSTQLGSSLSCALSLYIHLHFLTSGLADFNLWHTMQRWQLTALQTV